MSDISTYAILGSSILVGLLLLQAILSVYMTIVLMVSSRDRKQLNRETFGLLKKIEGLTAEKQQQFRNQYARAIAGLQDRLPIAIATQVGERIYQTESAILRHLAELEPNVDNPDAKRRFDELIKSMESLEENLIRVTAQTVHTLLEENADSLTSEAKLEAGATR